MMYVFGWFILSVAVAIYADRLNRSFMGWFFWSIIISPFLAGILVLASGPAPKITHDPEKEGSDEWDFGVSKPVLDESAPEIFFKTVKSAHELLVRNLITQEQFLEKKIEALIKFENSSFSEDSMTVLGKLIPLIDSGSIENSDIVRIKRKLGMKES